MQEIRNFSIIAHIDHGKSTLADRILELTHTVDPSKMRSQVLDTMELERERGITIKAQAVRVLYRARDGNTYKLHLIDTPGHVDFTYEVSRSLAACEGALLVVDAAQGVEAQTLANTYLAIDAGLELIPVMNKIDLQSAEPERVAHEIGELLGEQPEDILRISAKTGEGIEDVLEAIVNKIPPPVGDPSGPPRALIFDSVFDQYRGVVAFVRVVDGVFEKGEAIRAMQTGTRADIDEIGFFSPDMVNAQRLAAGEVGYIITGIKDVAKLRVGETLTSEKGRAAASPLPGYREARPVVFCGLYPLDTDRYADLRDALDKLALNDAALSYEPETSQALGFGFRCGFLGLLHMDIVRERLEREYGLELLATTPNVEYHVRLHGDEWLDVLVAGEPVDALSLITHRTKAQSQGRRLTEKLKAIIPRQLYEVPIQAAIGGKIIARETIPAMRKDVIAKCYGGDVTRKRKLLEKQKEGKKRMKRIGKVDIPQEAFLAVLKVARSSSPACD